MNVYEAMKNVSPHKPFIMRKSWFRVSFKSPYRGIRIQPTNSPDGCIIESDVEKENRRRWIPTAEDLLAEDWEAVL